MHESGLALAARWWIVTAGLSVYTLGSCAQLVAVLHQLGVHIKDVQLYGEQWVLTAANTTFLEVGHQPHSCRRVVQQVRMLSCSSRVAPVHWSR